MDVTSAGIVTDVREEQWANAEDLMVSTPSGIVTDVREEQP